MTTDNRTNVQIVADALRSMPEAERDDDRDPAVVVAEYAVAALVAAQGAARPVNGFDTTAERVKNAGESSHVLDPEKVAAVLLANAKSRYGGLLSEGAPSEALIQIFDQIDMPEYNPSANSGRGDWGLRNVSDGTVMTHPTDIVRCVEHGAMNSVSPNRAIWRCLMCGRSAYRDIAGDAALVAAGVAPQEPNQNETKSGNNFVSLDAEKVADVIEIEIEGLRHETRLYPDIYKRQVADALCEAYTEGKLT